MKIPDSVKGRTSPHTLYARTQWKFQFGNILRGFFFNSVGNNGESFLSLFLKTRRVKMMFRFLFLRRRLLSSVKGWKEDGCSNHCRVQTDLIAHAWLKRRRCWIHWWIDAERRNLDTNGILLISTDCCCCCQQRKSMPFERIQIFFNVLSNVMLENMEILSEKSLPGFPLAQVYLQFPRSCSLIWGRYIFIHGSLMDFWSLTELSYVKKLFATLNVHFFSWLSLSGLFFCPRNITYLETVVRGCF